MSLIHYLLTPLILFLVPYMVNRFASVIATYVLFANGAGGVDISKLHVCISIFVVKQSS